MCFLHKSNMLEEILSISLIKSNFINEIEHDQNLNI